MAHYRRGRKVAALSPELRLGVGLLTVAAVFAVVALVTWRPPALVLPGLVAVAALAVLDRLVVAARDRDPPIPTPHEGDVPWPDAAAAAGPAYTVDPTAPTTVVPRLNAPVTAHPEHTRHLGMPTSAYHGPPGPPPPSPAPAHAAPPPQPPPPHAAMPPPPPGASPYPDHRREHPHPPHDERQPPGRATLWPAQPQLNSDADMATMAIDMRAFLDP